MGDVGHDPDLQETKAGVQVCHFSLATNRFSPDGSDPPPDWHRITAWRKLATFCVANVRAGDRLYVDGEIQYNVFHREGVAIPTTDIIAREVVLFPRNKEEGDMGVSLEDEEQP